MEEISQSCVPLSSLVDIFVGVQTSADQIYIIHADREDDNFIYSYDRQGHEFQIEKGILRKSIYDTQLVSYERIKANSYIIFPYKAVNGRPVLYSLAEMTEDFPHALAYLNRFKDKLDERNMPGRTTENWFAFGRSQSLNVSLQENILFGLCCQQAQIMSMIMTWLSLLVEEMVLSMV